jgi:hypothetical protein
MVVSMGCQQRRKPPQLGYETIDITTAFCPCAEWVQWTRFFSAGTFNVVTCLVVVYLFTPTGQGGQNQVAAGKKE